jgi:hypothetical protein
MMTLTSGVMEMCACVLGPYVPSCIGRPVRRFFILETHGPQGTAGHVTETKSYLNWEARFEVIGHMTVQKLTSVER